MPARTSDIEAIYGLSPVQQDLFTSILSEPSASVSQHQAVYKCGGVDVDKLVDAWTETFARHAVLRTSFHWQNLSNPVQVIRHDVPPPLEILDLRGQQPAEQTQRLKSFLRDDRGRHFELSSPPLVRLSLVKISYKTCYVVWSYHSLVLDGRSVSRLFAELLHQYSTKSPLSEAAPFQDYLSWLPEHTADSDRFWSGYLRGLDTSRPLIATVSHTSEKSTIDVGDIKRCKALIPSKLVHGLRAIEKEYGFALTTMLNGAWVIVLARHNNRDDVVVGVPFPGRPGKNAAYENSIGPYSNLLPMRVDVSGRDRVMPWLSALQKTQFDMSPHQHTALQQIKHLAKWPENEPLFDTIVDALPVSETSSSGRQPRRKGIGTKKIAKRLYTSNRGLARISSPGRLRQMYCPMSLRWESEKKGFNAILEYVPDRVGKSIAIRLLHDLHSILSQIVRRPDCQVSDLIAPDELIVSLKTGRADMPAFYCVHPAGGSIGCYASLAAELSRVAPQQSIMAIQAPDADRIPASRQKLEKLAAFYLKALKKQQPIGPYCLGGWSSGGLVAYEMACQLVEQGEPVALLALFDTKPPTKKRAQSQENPRRQMLQFARQQGLKPHPAHNWLPTAKRLAEFLLVQMKQEHLLPPETTDKQFHRRYRLFQSHIKSASAFRPRAYSGRLDVFVPKTSKLNSADRKSGWDSLVKEVVMHTVPGSHHTMLGYPHVRQLAEQLSRQLGRNSS